MYALPRCRSAASDSPGPPARKQVRGIPVYEYEGKTEGGKEQAGTIEAPSRAAAMVRLRQQDLWIRVLHEQGAARPATDAAAAEATPAAPVHWGLCYGLRPVSPGALGVFFTQVAGLYRAGVGMQTLVEDTSTRMTNRWLRRFLEASQPRVAAGETLSSCMASFPQVFAAGVVGMVRTGELTGNLDEVALALADDYQAEQRIRWLILLPKAYFTTVLALASLVLSFPWVIKHGFHWWVSHIAGHVLPWWLAVAVVWLVLRVVWHLPGVFALRDRLAYWLPAWSGLTRRVALYRFYRSLELTTRAGVDFSVGMATAATAAGNSLMVRQLVEAASQVRNGVALHEALARCPFFSQEDLGALGAAALGGTYDDMLPRMALQAKAARDHYIGVVRVAGLAIAYAVTTLIVVLVAISAFVAIYRAQFERAGVGMEDLLQ